MSHHFFEALNNFRRSREILPNSRENLYALLFQTGLDESCSSLDLTLPQVAQGALQKASRLKYELKNYKKVQKKLLN